MLNLLKGALRGEQKTPGLLLHIGAGLCKELQEYLHIGFKSIHLLEADTAQVLQLEEKAQLANGSDSSVVRVHEKTVAKKAGSIDFYRTNNVFYDGLNNPSALGGLYPNLSILNVETRSAESLSSVITSLAPKIEELNVLVIDAWGGRDSILDGSLDELYSDFELVLMRGASEQEASKYVEALSGKYFHFIMSGNDDVHDEWVLFKKNKLAGDFDELSVRFQSLEKTKADLDDRCIKLQNEVLELKQCRDLVRGEIDRVESQIELIKDVVLREKAF